MCTSSPLLLHFIVTLDIGENYEKCYRTVARLSDTGYCVSRSNALKPFTHELR